MPETAQAAQVVPQVDEAEPAALEINQQNHDIDPIEPAVVAAVEEFLVEPRVEPPVRRPLAGDALSEVEARLGSEGLSRLRARYAEILARISETVSELSRQEELKGTAERLNPDTWVTEAEVRAGLEDYETVFESLRSVVGRRRGRRRRSTEPRSRRESVGSTGGSSVGQHVAQQTQDATNEAEPEPDAEEPGSGEHH